MRATAELVAAAGATALVAPRVTAWTTTLAGAGAATWAATLAAAWAAAWATTPAVTAAVTATAARAPAQARANGNCNNNNNEHNNNNTDSNNNGTSNAGLKHRKHGTDSGQHNLKRRTIELGQVERREHAAALSAS